MLRAIFCANGIPYFRKLVAPPVPVDGVGSPLPDRDGLLDTAGLFFYVMGMFVISRFVLSDIFMLVCLQIWQVQHQYNFLGSHPTLHTLIQLQMLPSKCSSIGRVAGNNVC